MPKRWNRTETWLALMAIGVGVVLFAIMGLFMYMSATSTPLHPSAESVPTSIATDPERQWDGAATRARELIRTALTEQNLPGLSVAVGVGDAIVWAEGFGWADLDRRVPVAPHLRFRIGTTSIALTSAAVGLLLERDRLSLDEPIQTYVPEFPPKPWPITLRQLMAHTAGVPSDGGDEGPLFTQHCERPVEAFPHFADRELWFQPGTEYRYSRFSWIPVSAAVEAVAKTPFLTFMQESVFDPLGMRDTRADSLAKVIPDRVTPYFPRFAADPRYGPDPMRDMDLSCYAGASVFLSTPSDLVRFGLAMNGGKLLQPATVEMLQTPQRLPSGNETGYGLGWDNETVTFLGRETRVVGHDGDVSGGIVGSLMLFRERALVVAVLANISYADTPGLALKVAEAFATADRRSESP